MPEALRDELAANHGQLQILINHCRTINASADDRNRRNTLLHATVKLCKIQVNAWAQGLFAAGVMTAADLYLLGFVPPGNWGGFRARKAPTDAIAGVKVKVINEDFVRMVIDYATGEGEDAARSAHGWPAGVKFALIVITSADGHSEIARRITTRIHNDIRMPEGSHGKLFIVKAAFLHHPGDEPRFGSAATFSMPLTTADLLRS